MFKTLEFTPTDEGEMLVKSSLYLEQMKTRRSVREFSDRPVPFEVIENVVMTAASAPSGANKQPWTFVIVKDPDIKRQIRLAAEKEEKEFYDHRAPEEWLEDLDSLGTNWHKPFLESAPYLIVVFKKLYDVEKTEETSPEHSKNYYVNESVGIASGFLLTAIHNAGLVALTHTPSPMGFLSEILSRPVNEKPFLLIPVGYPAEETQVPVLEKKSFEEVTQVF
ncbi:MAG: nitroreductase family protein [Candidatus Marinimicrobia bacterium]|jgi:nitroreductase|nr:nitroreductase family protein [Candidatus Neomarinimicrobiota bacterium]MDP7025828.1 nitroreductase family protein [Candidatus Neomarinimicrobiota bacterium]|tara:strand:+ start:558 stop:1223 length:666 start_codon:yes stop_codon:yes gene_type:complete